MAIVRQISVFLENQPGRLNALCDVLAEEGVNIEAIMVPSGTDYGIVHMVVDRPDVALGALQARAYRSYTSQVLDVQMENRPGALAGLARQLAEPGLDITYAYTAIASQGARLILSVSDAERAQALLEPAG